MADRDGLGLDGEAGNRPVAPLGEKTSITGIAQLRLSEDLPNPTYTAGGLELNYKAGNWTLSAGYRHQVTGDRGEEEHPNITQIALLMATYAFSLRPGGV